MGSTRKYGKWGWVALALSAVLAGSILAGCGVFTRQQLAGTNPVSPMEEEGDIGIDSVRTITITSITGSPVSHTGGTVTINISVKCNQDNQNVLLQYEILQGATVIASSTYTQTAPGGGGGGGGGWTFNHTGEVTLAGTVPPGTYDVRVCGNQPPGGQTWNYCTTQPGAVTKQPGPDQTPPTVAITFPVEGGCYNASSWGAITGTATDNVGVTKVEVYVDGNKVGEADLTNLPNWSLSYTPPECNHSVYAIAYDASNNSAMSTTINFCYDVTPPVVTITAPVNGACYQNAPAGAYTVVEAHSYTVAESGWSDAEGVHTYTVTATDCAGNVGWDSVTYIVDRTPPVVTITTPANGACFIVDTTVLANFSVTDNLDPSPKVTSTVPNGNAIDTSTVGGPYDFKVEAEDCAGNKASVTHTYSVVLPTFRGIYPPYGSRPSIKRGSTFPIKWGYTACGELADSANAQFTLVIKNPSGTVITNTYPGKSGGPRYDPITKQWIFNWQISKTAPTGDYKIQISGQGIWPGSQEFTVRVTR